VRQEKPSISYDVKGTGSALWDNSAILFNKNENNQKLK
jgi:hypothetical protein